MNENLDLMLKYGKWYDKKAQSLSPPQKIIMRRTLNTAINVVASLKEIPFVELSTSLYFFCQDVQTKQFTRLYEAQMELAGADGDRFIKGLHKFYQNTARMIKKDGLLPLFLEFLTLCSRVRFEYLSKGKEHQINATVLNLYLSVLLQQSEYLRPSQFDLSQALCGMTTAGEPMGIKDTYVNFDAPTAELEKLMRDGWEPKSKAELQNKAVSLFHKHGYTKINSFEDFERIRNIDQIYASQHYALAAYINEYTYDILPDPEHAFSASTIPFYFLQYDKSLDAEKLKETLRYRSKTLPTNGVYVKFQDNPLLTEPRLFSEIMMKETLHGDSIVMLYRCQTVCGDLCGYFDTQDGFFFSIFLDSSDKTLFDRIQMLLLYLYASQVTRNGPTMLKEISSRFWYSPPKPHSTPHNPLRCPFQFMDGVGSWRIPTGSRVGKRDPEQAMTHMNMRSEVFRDISAK